MPIIYLDVLFFVNLKINALLIYCTGKILHLKFSSVRFIMGSVISALYSVFMFFPNFGIFYTTFSKLLFSMFIIALSYNIKGIKLFCKALVLFYLVTVFFGGCVFLIFCFTDIGSKTGAIIKNGVIYFDMPWHILIFSIGAAFIFATVILKNIFKRNAKTHINLQITYLGRNAEITALIDTGNNLSDPITHEPVIVAEYDSIKELLPPEFEKRSCFSENTNILSRMRIIPFTSIGKENGILIGFKPDKIVSASNENLLEINDVIIGISNTPLSKDKSFQALMPPGIII